MNNKNRNLWTTQAISQLRELAAQGKTSTEIAEIMGVSRGAVIGKQQREGIVLMGRPLMYGVSPGSARPDPNAVLPMAERSGVGPAMLALKPSHCRWPIGAVEEPDFHYCSARRADRERPYCAKHEAVATSGSAAAKALTHREPLTAAWTGVS